MRPDSRRLLSDMLTAAELLREFARGRTVDDFGSDKLLRAGIYFQFIIIGEALSQLRATDVETAERISEFHRVIGFRNQVIHGYAEIDDEITWRIIGAKLPILVNELRVLLVE